jgi:hypothetical protein
MGRARPLPTLRMRGRVHERRACRGGSSVKGAVKRSRDGKPWPVVPTVLGAAVLAFVLLMAVGFLVTWP